MRKDHLALQAPELHGRRWAAVGTVEGRRRLLAHAGRLEEIRAIVLDDGANITYYRWQWGRWDVTQAPAPKENT